MGKFRENVVFFQINTIFFSKWAIFFEEKQWETFKKNTKKILNFSHDFSQSCCDYCEYSVCVIDSQVWRRKPFFVENLGVEFFHP